MEKCTSLLARAEVAMQLRTTAVSQVTAFLREARVTDCNSQSDTVNHVRGVNARKWTTARARIGVDRTLGFR